MTAQHLENILSSASELCPLGLGIPLEVIDALASEIQRLWAENATMADALVQSRTLCRKHGHATAEDASAIARDMELAGKGRFKIYSCEKCGRYHVARAVPKRTRRRRGSQ